MSKRTQLRQETVAAQLSVRNALRRVLLGSRGRAVEQSRRQFVSAAYASVSQRSNLH